MTQRKTLGQGAARRCRPIRFGRLGAAVAAAVAAAGLAACSTVSEKMAGTLSEMPGIGLPAGVPERPAEQLAYPAVHDMPPPRSAAVLSEVEQQKMEDDLVAARDAQRASAGRPAAKKKPARAASPVVPASSSRTIY
jgi:hypothetical protein